MRHAAWLLAIVWVALPATARADVFGPIALVSAGAANGSSVRQQADYARDPAISGDGHYVAFDGSFGGREGVWRRDLDSGTLEAVTVCAAPSDPHPASCDAELPSISADGRYVSFTTTAALTRDDTNLAPDVYVRDMQTAEGEAAFALASAADGKTQGLAYEPPGSPPSAIEQTAYGSVAAGCSAISADGRRVAFVTTVISNLSGAGTPALQVAVRDLDTLTTQLVSVAADSVTGAPELDEHGLPKPVAGAEGEFTYGAVYSPGAAPPRFTTSEPYAMAPRVGASISADGSTVAWMGQDVGSQTRTLSEEALLPVYAEPLWRRIDAGPQAPTLRVSGGDDVASPACIASGEGHVVAPASLADPCQGPFRVEAPLLGVFSEVAADSVPQLSADGYTVAFLANAPTLAEGGDFGASISSLHTDVYVADMHAGLSRTRALRPLTELAGAKEDDIATNAAAIDLGVSPDGTQVAFTTKRTIFPLGSPAYVSAPAGAPGMVELFDADLAQDTITRVTQGFEGGPAEHPHVPVAAEVDPYEKPSDGALSPSFSADGDTLAFSSTASNLVYGDGNTPPLGAGGAFDGADAFTVQRVRFGSQPTPQEISPAPSSPPLELAWRLGVTPLSRRDGSVLLYVQAPQAGRLDARATGAMVVRSGRGRRAREHVLVRTVASASAASAADGSARVALVLAPRYRALAGRSGGLTSTVTVAFALAGHPALRASVVVTFRRSPTHGAHKAGAVRAGRVEHRRRRGGR